MNNRYSYDEQKLTEEVIYLHSLWHQGPPTQSNPIPIPIPIPILNPNPIPIPTPFHYPPPHHQHPFAPSYTRSFPHHTSTSYTNINKKRPRDTEPGIEWPCPPSPGPSPKKWGPLKPHFTLSPALTTTLSAQEKEKLSVLRAQTKASKAIRDILINDSDDSDKDDDNKEDDYDLEEIEDIIVGIFMEDDEMRGYYQKCYESGEFCCLVCGAIGKKKSGRRYKDCNRLVQHSMSISVKKTAHRAFGQAVCKVLGWDIHRFPTIVMKEPDAECSSKRGGGH
ncbi:unnamed protein product [Lupinus luteus]|uniref:Uncharacterized protein n=1 Tax=Lupinus luteus TaxID=3873 RepID=A0AAV1YL96_LUPLU